MRDVRVNILYASDVGPELVGSLVALTMVNKPLDAIYNGMTKEHGKRLVDNVLAYDHQSITEHASFTFLLEGVSRTFLAQITRHRIASYTSKSQQYQDHSDFPYVTPKGIEELDDGKDHLKRKYHELMVQINRFYRELVANGVDKDEARYVLPNACRVNLVVTMNTRSLYNFFRQRICRRNTLETQHVARLMLQRLHDCGYDWLFGRAGPACYNKGKCDQGHMTCKKSFWSFEEVLGKERADEGPGCQTS